MVVVLLLALIWAAVLLPPAVQAHAARREAFLVSFGAPPTGDVLAPPRAAVCSSAVRRRRHIVASLLLAMAGTGLAGLLPTFRVLVIVYLFLDDSFLAYVALLAHQGDRRAKAAAGAIAPAPVADGAPARGRRRLPRPAILVDLPLGPSTL